MTLGADRGDDLALMPTMPRTRPVWGGGLRGPRDGQNSRQGPPRLPTRRVSGQPLGKCQPGHTSKVRWLTPSVDLGTRRVDLAASRYRDKP